MIPQSVEADRLEDLAEAAIDGKFLSEGDMAAIAQAYLQARDLADNLKERLGESREDLGRMTANLALQQQAHASTLSKLADVEHRLDVMRSVAAAAERHVSRLIEDQRRVALEHAERMTRVAEEMSLEASIWRAMAVEREREDEYAGPEVTHDRSTCCDPRDWLDHDGDIEDGRYFAERDALDYEGANPTRVH